MTGGAIAFRVGCIAIVVQGLWFFVESLRLRPTWMRAAAERRLKRWQMGVIIARALLATVAATALLGPGMQWLLWFLPSGDGDRLGADGIAGALVFALAFYISRVYSRSAELADAEDELKIQKLLLPLEEAWGDDWDKAVSKVKATVEQERLTLHYDERRLGVLKEAVERAENPTTRARRRSQTLVRIPEPAPPPPVRPRRSAPPAPPGRSWVPGEPVEPKAISPDSLEKLWKALWDRYEWWVEERTVVPSVDTVRRYAMKITAGAVLENLGLLHAAFSPGGGACSKDCMHVRTGLSAAQVGEVLASVDRELANYSNRTPSANVPEDDETKIAALNAFRGQLLAASDP